jgi:hypothetical protein
MNTFTVRYLLMLIGNDLSCSSRVSAFYTLTSEEHLNASTRSRLQTSVKRTTEATNSGGQDNTSDADSESPNSISFHLRKIHRRRSFFWVKLTLG